MLATIREFALEQLVPTGEETATRQAHAEYFLRLAEEVETARTQATRSPTIPLLGNELANLRAAIGWLHESGDARRSRLLAGALWPLWFDHGDMAEARLHLTASLALPDPSGDRIAWARAAVFLGAIAQAQGDHDQAGRLSEESLAVFQEHGDARGTAWALTTLGLDAMVRGDYNRAVRSLEAAVPLFRSVGDPRAGSWALRHLASVAFRCGDIVRAQALAEAGLAEVRGAGTDVDIARLLHTLGVATAARGDIARATVLWNESLVRYQRAEDAWGVADVLSSLGDAAHEQADEDRAIALLEEGLARLRRIGDPEGTAIALSRIARARRAVDDAGGADRDLQEGLRLAQHHDSKSSAIACLTLLGVLALDDEDLDRAEASLREAVRLAADVGDRRAVAAALEWTAHLAAARDRAWAGATVIGAVEELRANLAVPTPIADRAEHTALAELLEARLGGASFTAAKSAGGTLEFEEAVAAALAGIAPVDEPHPGRTHPRHHSLTEREVGVLRLLAAGRTDKQIADELRVSKRTVTTHVTHILSKLGAANRTEAVAAALRTGLVDPGRSAIEPTPEEWAP
jgi:DNA-binding NarL/FixJ family response regulator